MAVYVALRKESVDRNAIMPLRSRLKRASLSARRAWIEMRASLYYYMDGTVALRKESIKCFSF